MPTTVNGTALSAVPTGINAQNITYLPNSDGGNEVHNYRNFTIQPNWNFYPVATRIITEITGGNTLNIGTHNFNITGASFTVTTAGNPNGLTTNTTYFIDTIPSSTTITLRTNSVSGGAVTGLTNGTGLFISAQAAAQSFTGDKSGSALILYGSRRGQNYTGASAPGSNNTTDSNRTNDTLGAIFFNGLRNSSSIVQLTGIQGRCTEDWTSATNSGSEILINTVKNGTATVYTTQIGANASVIRSDTFDVFNTAGTNTLDLDINGNLIITGDIRVNGNDIQNSAGNNNIQLSSTATNINADVTRFFTSNSNGLSNIQFNPGNAQGAGVGDRQNGFALFMRRNPAQTTERPQVALNNWIQDPSTLTYSANQSGEVLGVFQFSGQYSTTGTSASNGPAVEFGARAAENFTSTANGGRAIIMVDKIGTTTSYDAVAIDSSDAYFRSNNIYFQDNNSTALTSAAINYTRTYGEFAYANAAGFAIAAQNTIYAMPLDTTLVSSGTSISNTSRINITVAGFYKIFMSLQSTLTVTNQPGQFDFWLRKNGVDVANSKTQVDLLKDQKTVTSMHWLVESDGNDYWEIMYVGTTANYADIDFPTIAATTTPYVSPVAPALLVNVIPVGM
jgi:hypothetical protein